jgi:hypothetical protein
MERGQIVLEINRADLQKNRTALQNLLGV